MELHPDLNGKKLEKLKKGQIKMTDMFRHFNDLCRKYDIKYWCIGGTLIGIIRKDKINQNGENVGGWIPFDADIDISMLDTDYQLFKSIAHELPKTMFLQDSQTDKLYNIKNMNKIRDINSHYVNYTPYGSHKGLQIDIFIWTKERDKVICNFCGQKRYDYIDVIFPVRNAEFEGFNVYIPNKYEEYTERKCGGYPPPYLPLIKRLPHEGDIEPDIPHPNDLKLYPHLYSNVDA